MSQTVTPARRGFLQAAAGLAATGAALASAPAPPLSGKEKLARIASNTWPLRMLFQTRATGRAPSPRTLELRKKYGEITMLGFPRLTTELFPGVTRLDLFSGLFGDVHDGSMYAATQVAFGQNTRTVYEFDPSSASARKWLDRLNAAMDAAGVHCHHISNNAPRDLCEPDPEKRRAGISVAKKWLDAAAQIGARTMRVNSGGPRIAPGAAPTADYPKNDEIVKYLAGAIESLKELADYGGGKGVKVTLENHWGLTANPVNIRIILEEVNHPFCEASPDFCNWEHEYLLYHGIQALLPYTHTTVHAKYWNRWPHFDIRRCVRLMTAGGYAGVFALEYEDGPWDGVEGAQYLFKEVMAAL